LITLCCLIMVDTSQSVESKVCKLAFIKITQVTMRRTTKEALEQLLPDIMTTCLRRGGRADRRAEFTI